MLGLEMIPLYGNGTTGLRLVKSVKKEFESLKTDQDYATWFYENGYTTSDDLDICSIDDGDQYNITICDASDGRPLFAIEYGPEY